MWLDSIQRTSTSILNAFSDEWRFLLIFPRVSVHWLKEHNRHISAKQTRLKNKRSLGASMSLKAHSHTSRPDTHDKKAQVIVDVSSTTQPLPKIGIKKKAYPPCLKVMRNYRHHTTHKTAKNDSNAMFLQPSYWRVQTIHITMLLVLRKPCRLIKNGLWLVL